MKHYICTGGCHGESEVPGVCNSPTCPKHNHPLIECCEDGLHSELVAKCENCEKTAPEGKKVCQGSCDIEPFKPELTS